MQRVAFVLEADGPVQAKGAGDVGSDFGVSASDMSVAVTSCASGASNGYTASSGVLAITLASTDTPVVMIGATGGYVTVNGTQCVNSAGVPLMFTGTASATNPVVKQITVNTRGTTGQAVLIVDLIALDGSLSDAGVVHPPTWVGGNYGNLFAGNTATMGIVAVFDSTNLGKVLIRGTTGNDNVTAGVSPTNAAEMFIDVSGDKKADIVAVNANALGVSLIDGNDIFSGMGQQMTTGPAPYSLDAGANWASADARSDLDVDHE